MKIWLNLFKKREEKKLFKIFKKGKDFKRKVERMTKENAINYLKLLHKLEKKFSKNLFNEDLKKLAEKLRKDFIKAYNK